MRPAFLVEDTMGFVCEGLGHVAGNLNGEVVNGTAWLEMQPVTQRTARLITCGRRLSEMRSYSAVQPNVSSGKNAIV